MVLDPHLGRHLAHWGINMMQVGWIGLGWVVYVVRVRGRQEVLERRLTARGSNGAQAQLTQSHTQPAQPTTPCLPHHAAGEDGGHNGRAGD